MPQRARLPFLAWILCFLSCFSACSARSDASSPEAKGPAASPSEKRESDLPEWSSPIPEPTASRAPRPRAALASERGEVLLRYPRSVTPWLGVELQATKSEDAGVKITRVLPGSPAEKAKLRADDVLLMMGQRPATAPSEVAGWVRSQEPGSLHPLGIQRAGQAKLLRVALDGMPVFEDRLRLAFVGRPAPEITGVATFQGEASSLSELRGQVVILEFWASYCGVCRYLGPVLDEWHRNFLPQGGHVVGITVDGPKLGLEVAQRTGMHYTLASDPQGKVSRRYLATQIPAVIVIDRKGLVRDAMVGYSKQRLKETKSLIQSLLEEDR